jgi:hypothetical protein
MMATVELQTAWRCKACGEPWTDDDGRDPDCPKCGAKSREPVALVPVGAMLSGFTPGPFVVWEGDDSFIDVTRYAEPNSVPVLVIEVRGA